MFFFHEDGSDTYHSRYLYVLILALDACFRLKRRIISSENKDPGLGTGWGYFVEDEPYREYLLTVTDQDEVRFFLSLCIFWFLTRYREPDEYMQRSSGTGSCQFEIFAGLCDDRGRSRHVREARIHTKERGGGSTKGGTVCTL